MRLPEKIVFAPFPRITAPYREQSHFFALFSTAVVFARRLTPLSAPGARQGGILLLHEDTFFMRLVLWLINALHDLAIRAESTDRYGV